MCDQQVSIKELLKMWQISVIEGNTEEGLKSWSSEWLDNNKVIDDELRKIIDEL